MGLNWRIPNVQGKRAVRHVVFDTNYWKSFVHARLAVAMGDRGCLSLFGDNPDLHRLFAEHITAEYRVKTEGRGRTVDEWKLRAAAVDNHWLDCLVGCAVAASIQGAILPGTDVRSARKNHGSSSQTSARQTIDGRQFAERPNDEQRGLECRHCAAAAFSGHLHKALPGGPVDASAGMSALWPTDDDAGNEPSARGCHGGVGRHLGLSP